MILGIADAPMRFDDIAHSQITFNIETFFRQELKEVLDALINFLKSNMLQYVNTLKPQFDLFQIPF